VPFSCHKGGMGVEMRVLVRISPFLLLPDRFRVKPYPSSKKKGGVKICRYRIQCVGLFARQNGAFLETLETRFLATTCVSEALLNAPISRHALSSFMVWNAGVGPWWAILSNPGCRQIFKVGQNHVYIYGAYTLFFAGN